MGKAQDVRLPAFPGREPLICNLLLVRIMFTEPFDIYDASTLHQIFCQRDRSGCGNVEEPHMPNRDPRDYLPDVADGLTHRERVVLWYLKELQQDRGGRHVPTGMLYGSVVEHVDMSVDEMQSILVRLIGHPLRS